MKKKEGKIERKKIYEPISLLYYLHRQVPCWMLLEVYIPVHPINHLDQFLQLHLLCPTINESKFLFSYFCHTCKYDH